MQKQAVQQLTPASFHFLRIIYVIHQILTYYADLFGIDVPESPKDLNAEIFQNKNIRYIRFLVPVIKEFNSEYSLLEIRKILNEYLQVTLASCKAFPPFCAGRSYHDMMEQLYIKTYTCSDSGYLLMDVLYIDNMDAYRLARQIELEDLQHII